jgi:hypothetical protein
MRLTDLFADFASSWPADKINTSWPPSTDGSGLAAQAANTIEVEDVVTAVGPDGTVTVTGKLSLLAGASPAPTLTSHLFPSLSFTFDPELDWKSDFRASIAPAGGASTVQIDTLPLKVSVPPDLLRAHQFPAATDPASGIELSDGAGDTVIKRDFSFLFDVQREIHLESHLPISIGPCTLFGVPAKAVHELTLIGSPDHASAQVDWLVRDLGDAEIAFQGGVLAFGGIELDWDVPGSRSQDLRARLRLSHEAHVIIEDLALPSVLYRPAPLHGTLGVRRNLDLGESLSEHLTFADAPVVIPLGRSADLFLDKFFFRTPAEGEEWWSGLTLEAGVSWPDSSGDDFEAEVGLIDGDVLRVSFAHTPPPTGEDLPVVRLDVWKYVVDFFRIRVGLSLDELRKDSPSGSDPGDAVQALVDILIQEKPGGSGGASDVVDVKTEDGRPFEAAINDVGWDRGKPSGAMTMPHGAQLQLSRFVLEVHEMGLAYENGATYFSVSGAIREKTAPLEGGVWFTRMRGKLAGNPDAPSFQLGGLGLDLKVEDVVEITAHGSYRDERLPDGTSIKEQGLGGGLVIYAGGNKWGLTIDVFWGSRTPPSGEASDFFLLLVALFGAIPMGPLELRGIEALYATGLMPKIEDGDREAGELKYYKWLKRARPIALPESRGPEAWTATPDSWAFGVGLGVSITGCGSVVQLKAFGAGFDSPTTSGLIVVVEFGLFGAKKPLAVGVFEYDFRSGAFVLMIQIDVTLAELIDNFPPQLDVRLGGTFTFGNQPGLVAIGRLGDPDTWLGGKLELELSQVFELKLRLAVCFEWLEDEHVGGGLTLSLKVAGRLGVIRLEGWGALEVLVRFMLTGTNDFVARLRVELGFAVILFGFLRFGISLELLAEWLAHVPNYFAFRVTFRFETPWFLPDVSYSLEVVDGVLEPGERGVATSPLLQAGALAPSGSLTARVQRADSGNGGEPTALASVNGLVGTNGAWRGEAQPIPLDATVEIDFSVMLVDELGIGAMNPDLGEQVSGDGNLALTTRYRLVGLTMRRRPLTGGAWETVEELTSAASPRNFRWSWDDDTRVQGQVAPKKLLLNGRTPFTVALDNPLADAQILEDNPWYPCCQVRRPDVARFDFDDDEFGTLPAGFVRSFRFEDRGTPAPVRIQGLACVVRPPHTSGATTARVGAFAPATGPVATITANEDLAAAVLRVAVDGRRKARLVMVALDAGGSEVARHHDNTGASPFVEVPINPGVVFRTIVVLVEDLERGQDDTSAPATIVLDSVECLTQRDRERFDRERDRCSREGTDGVAQPVNFLPRHEYEIALTTEVAVRHSSTEWETATLTERVGFVTAGPPGLNETPEPGLELEPYVVSLPPGGRGLTYREEAVHLLLSDRLRMFGPGSGTSEADNRLPITIVIESAFDANPDAHVGKGSRATAEWFLAHRAVSDPWLTGAVLGLARAFTRDGAALRYRALSEASAGTCPPDDTWVEQQPSVVVDPFEPSGAALWEPMASYVATMRLAGSPVVDRDPFEAADVTSFATITGAWTFDEGALVASAATTGVFGDVDWDLYRVDVRGAVRPAGELGVVVLHDPTNPAQGVRALIRRDPGGGGTLVVESTAGVPIDAVPIGDLGDESALVVEAFADAVRCRCGDAMVSVPRDDRRTGGCVLLATDARVTSLRVHGLDMYRQPFRTSRYDGFGEHVGSCTGLERYDAGAAAEPLAALLTRLGGAVAAAMASGAPAVDREARFSEVASALAAPLREDPRQVHITCMASPTDRWLLLETPEPMDFTEEIVLVLALKVVRPGLSDADRTRLGALIEATLREPQSPSPWPGPFRPDRLGVRRLVVPEALLGVLDAPRARRPAYSATLEGKFLVVTNVSIGTVTKVRAPSLSLADRTLLMDVTVDLNASLQIIRWHTPDLVEWVNQDVAVIQDGPATHTLILPEAEGLADGTYRLTMALTRRWFDTADPVGLGNAYLDDATIEFELAG